MATGGLSLFSLHLIYQDSAGPDFFCFWQYAFVDKIHKKTFPPNTFVFVNTLWAEDATLVVAVASGSWAADNGIAVVDKAAGKQVNAMLASDCIYTACHSTFLIISEPPDNRRTCQASSS